MAIKLRQAGIVVFTWCSLMAGLGGNCMGNHFDEIVIFVDDDAPAGGDGLTWETSYRFLQDALVFAAVPENGVSEIRTAQGVYKPDRDEGNPKGDGGREGTFQLINGVSLLGGYAGIGADNPDERDIELNETILSGDLLGDDEADFKNNDENSFHVVTGRATDNSAVIEGFTITAGNANDSGNTSAGGMNNRESNNENAGSPIVNSCRFVSNWAQTSGGGIVIDKNTNPKITNCIFIENRGFLGGGMSNRADDATISGCQFIGNTAFVGGGIHNVGNVTISDCEFIDNEARNGGGMQINGFMAKPLIVNCRFIHNTADYNGIGYGGGLYVYSSTDPTIVNCIFSNNSTSKSGIGGGLYLGGEELGRLINSTIINNTSGTDGGVYYFYGLRVYNCIIWGNENGQISDADDPYIENLVTYNCIEGGAEGIGNIDIDPLFVDPQNGNFHLLPDSPCIDSGFNNAVPHDFADLDNDDDFSEFLPFDLDDNPRFVDDSKSIGTGCGILALVDMGAFEFQDGKASQPLPGDFDGDGVITQTDLIELLSEWGQCDSCCLADLDANGLVDTFDLLLFLSSWN